jgi:erythronate-4-phosphate dehydrogenase
MKALADEHIFGLEGIFAPHLELRACHGRAITRADLGDAEVLLVRAVTRVDEALLADSQVRFVGTVTIGTDHLDTDWLDEAGIAWASAPGSNADAAAQYTLGMILLACRRLDRDPLQQRVGILGHGNVGQRLHALLAALGLDCVVRDPKRAAVGELPDVTLENVLDCDVLCLHTPLTRDGPWPTADLIDAAALAAMRTGALLVNSARGGVVNEQALQAALDRGALHAALDVWPREPSIAPALLEATTVASPHVAGYSLEGKARGTRMILEAFLAWSGQRAGRSAGRKAGDDGGDTPAECLDLPPDTADAVTDAVVSATRVARDDRWLRDASPLTPEVFDALRRAHTPRHEFNRIAVRAPAASEAALRGLGFGWVNRDG